MTKNKVSVIRKQGLYGWVFIAPAALLIALFSFIPMILALMQSFMTGVAPSMRFAGLFNFRRLLQDQIFRRSVGNTLLYLVVQVPIMLTFALILASLLNQKDLKFRGLLRTMIFLPCATSLVSYSMIFRTLFAVDGFVNAILRNLNIINTPINWLGHPIMAKVVIIIALLWRWTGYNMIFYLAGLQNIESSIYESARIDGAGPVKTMLSITIPQLKPVILLTAITSTSGTLQLFDESMNLTAGGPANATISMSHYIYNVSFVYSPNFGYASALSYVIFMMVAVLALLQMRVGDKRD